MTASIEDRAVQWAAYAGLRWEHLNAGEREHYRRLVRYDVDRVTTAAPIIGYMAEQGWTRDRVRDYCRRRGWSIHVVDQWPK